MAVLNSGTIIAVAEETVLGGGKATAWADIDVISFKNISSWQKVFSIRNTSYQFKQNIIHTVFVYV